MSKPKFISYEEAKEFVGDILEMEHPHKNGERVFNVYNRAGKIVCWFDADEVEAEIEAEEFEEIKDHILHFIPDWAL